MKKNQDNYTPINIETLILVAVWTQPFVFQGSFKIINKNKQTEQFLFYRCERDRSEKTDIVENEFSPDDYQFTHLYRSSGHNQLDFVTTLSEDAFIS